MTKELQKSCKRNNGGKMGVGARGVEKSLIIFNKYFTQSHLRISNNL